MKWGRKKVTESNNMNILPRLAKAEAFTTDLEKRTQDVETRLLALEAQVGVAEREE